MIYRVSEPNIVYLCNPFTLVETARSRMAYPFGCLMGAGYT